MGRKREFISARGPDGGRHVPPVATMEIAANCAEPAKTMADMAIACRALIPASTARMPKDADTSSPAAANGKPSRTPRRKDSRAGDTPPLRAGLDQLDPVAVRVADEAEPRAALADACRAASRARSPARRAARASPSRSSAVIAMWL